MREYIDMNVNHSIDKMVIGDVGKVLLFLKAMIVILIPPIQENMQSRKWMNILG
ncbi:hypothetical protein [uncultured Coprobacter sp.]|jgi:hypothetical protein|uniref:hypothetical protein n=1 Tax=uncultured Coprobacter sp. TaxID=1720550 RepID=UPI0025F5F5D2|nr:hypothetical protein [uncultured Coprobacter sp.]